MPFYGFLFQIIAVSVAWLPFIIYRTKIETILTASCCLPVSQNMIQNDDNTRKRCDDDDDEIAYFTIR